MAPSERAPVARRLIAGLGIGLGLAVNQWTLEATVVADGTISSPWLRLAILLFQLLCITGGILVWRGQLGQAIAYLASLLRTFYLDDRPGTRMRLPGEGGVVLLLVGMALFVVVVRSARLEATFPDDTYITFRFAEHLAAGEGLVWNVGDERTEGFTSPLHVA